MPYDDIVLEAEDKMEKAISVMVDELKGVRTGRATPGLVENIKVDYYGAPTPLRQIANISIPDPRMIMIKAFDPGSLGEIEKAIQKSGSGLNPLNDGKVIRVPIPPLSEERRRQMADMVKETGEKAKIAIRNIRRDGNKQADDEEKAKKISEDERERTKDEIQKLTGQYEGKVGDVLAKKTKEIMEV